jgi:hypothetical protein
VLFVDRQAVGVIEAKKQGTTLSGVEWQTMKYQANVPGALPAMLLDGLLPYAALDEFTALAESLQGIGVDVPD